MKGATFSPEVTLNYCQAVINAETEEEILAAKEKITEYLREKGYGSEEEIQTCISYLDTISSQIENEEIIIGENGELIQNPEYMQTEMIGIEESTPATNYSLLSRATLAIGVTGAAIVVVTALKNKVLKNQKNKTR